MNEIGIARENRSFNFTQLGGSMNYSAVSNVLSVCLSLSFFLSLFSLSFSLLVSASFDLQIFQSLSPSVSSPVSPFKSLLHVQIAQFNRNSRNAMQKSQNNSYKMLIVIH